MPAILRRRLRVADHPLDARPEHLWAPRLLGENRFPGNRFHTRIRKIVIQHFTSATSRALLLGIIGVALVTYDARRLWPAGLACWLLAYFYVRRSSGSTLRNASVLWARFRDRENISEKEMELITEHFQLLHRFDRLIFGCINVLTVTTGILLVRHHGFIAGILIAIGSIFFTLVLFSRIVLGRTLLFQQQVEMNSADLHREYDIAFKGRTAAEFRNRRALTYGDIIFVVFLAILVGIKLTQQTTRLFDAFTLVVGVGGLLLFYVAGSEEISVRIPRSLRRPKAPFLSYLLSLHLFHTFVIGPLWFVFGLLALMSIIDQPKEHFLWIGLIGGFLIFFCEMFLATGTIRGCKRLFARSFNIAYFRRFDPDSAAVDRSAITPVFGAYGRLFLVRDKSFEGAKGIQSHYEDALNEFWSSISFADDEWKGRVQQALAVADLVVFHWRTAPTENMLWEFLEAKKLLPKERLIWVCDKKMESIIRPLLQQNQSELDSKANLIMFRRSPPYLEFSTAVYRCLKKLRPLPRHSQAEFCFTPDNGEGSKIA